MAQLLKFQFILRLRNKCNYFKIFKFFISRKMSEKDKTRKQRGQSPQRKAREHPYTKLLNRIKSKICYYKKRMNDEKDEKKKEIINDVIEDLEYERFILKLNSHDIQVINKFCLFNNIEIDIEELLKQFSEDISE